MTGSLNSDERVLILTPLGRDSTLAEQLLAASGVQTKICSDVPNLADELAIGAGTAVVASEALDQRSIRRLAELLSRQPPWSDLSLIILTTGGATTKERERHLQELSVLRNATVLERPLRASTLVNSVEVALQARRRQYELRDHLIERERLERELEAAYIRQHRIAETLQRSLLNTPQSDAYPGLEIETVYQAAQAEAEVGGDFYDIFTLNEDCVAFIVADVSGKGLLAASRTMEAKYALRAYLRDDASPCAAMRRLNAYLLDSQRLDPGEHSGFICVCTSVLNKRSGQLQVCNAGLESPLLVKSDQSIELLEGNGPPLGVSELMDFPEIARTLTGSDTLIVYTDGITEARRQSEFFGQEGIIEALNRLQDRSLKAMTGAVIDSATEYASGNLGDDVCIVAIRSVGAGN